mmetsp:Transcript_6636/g.12593  ORF Transcript_6636/g.12593 Transcript_6636/m.12593 type:complete len:320 (-) Transcript_6636:478-1437(-)
MLHGCSYLLPLLVIFCMRVQDSAACVKGTVAGLHSSWDSNMPPFCISVTIWFVMLPVDCSTSLRAIKYFLTVCAGSYTHTTASIKCLLPATSTMNYSQRFRHTVALLHRLLLKQRDTLLPVHLQIRSAVAHIGVMMGNRLTPALFLFPESHVVSCGHGAQALGHRLVAAGDALRLRSPVHRGSRLQLHNRRLAPRGSFGPRSEWGVGEILEQERVVALDAFLVGVSQRLCVRGPGRASHLPPPPHRRLCVLGVPRSALAHRRVYYHLVRFAIFIREQQPPSEALLQVQTAIYRAQTPCEPLILILDSQPSLLLINFVPW